jgi:hypothetical protein
MTLATAELLVNTAGLYGALGGVFAAVFLTWWVGRLDPAARHATWGFRAIVFPGVALFWPLFLLRLLRRQAGPPDEWTAHRAGARRVRVEVLR